MNEQIKEAKEKLEKQIKKAEGKMEQMGHTLKQTLALSQRSSLPRPSWKDEYIHSAAVYRGPDLVLYFC